MAKRKGQPRQTKRKSAIDSFYELSCTKNVKLSQQDATFASKDHVAVTCPRCKQNHIISLSSWESARDEIAHSKTLPESKILQFFTEVQTVDVADEVLAYIHARPEWTIVSHWLKESEAAVASLQDEACLNYENHVIITTPRLSYCKTHEDFHSVEDRRFKHFASKTSHKDELMKLKPSTPELVFVYLEEVLEGVYSTLLRRYSMNQEAVVENRSIPVKTPARRKGKRTRTAGAFGVVLKAKGLSTPGSKTKTTTQAVKKVSPPKKVIFEPVQEASSIEEVRQVQVSKPVQTSASSHPARYNLAGLKYLNNVTVKPLEYILPPELVSIDLMVEYMVCGRKRHYSSPGEAAKGIREFTNVEADGVKEVYACPHCDGYHYGTNSKKPLNRRKTAASGFMWYCRKPAIANRFIHRIMTEG
jgi:hypothetical protein